MSLELSSTCTFRELTRPNGLGEPYANIHLTDEKNIEVVAKMPKMTHLRKQHSKLSIEY